MVKHVCNGGIRFVDESDLELRLYFGQQGKRTETSNISDVAEKSYSNWLI